jgi:hypothetical protein
MVCRTARCTHAACSLRRGGELLYPALRAAKSSRCPVVSVSEFTMPSLPDWVGTVTIAEARGCHSSGPRAATAVAQRPVLTFRRRVGVRLGGRLGCMRPATQSPAPGRVRSGSRTEMLIVSISRPLSLTKADAGRLSAGRTPTDQGHPRSTPSGTPPWPRPGYRPARQSAGATALHCHSSRPVLRIR